jgi:hypothetical protein
MTPHRRIIGVDASALLAPFARKFENLFKPDAIASLQALTAAGAEILLLTPVRREQQLKQALNTVKFYYRTGISRDSVHRWALPADANAWAASCHYYVDCALDVLSGVQAGAGPKRVAYQADPRLVDQLEAPGTIIVESSWRRLATLLAPDELAA